jgi:ribonuclease BN (tRNA processing enzyme)
LIHDGVHTPPKDAAAIAQQAGVGRLVLIHYPQDRAARILAEAQAVFPNTELAREGHTLEIPATE